MANRIAELRKRLGLSQRALAEQAKTSQQQIQRIEAGAQIARFDLAARIAVALDAPLRVVFPETELPKPRRGRAADAPIGLPDLTKEERAGLEKGGIDPVWEQSTLRYCLTGGVWGCLPISGVEKARLWKITQDCDAPEGFIVFDSGPRRYAINSKYLSALQFLFDPIFEDAKERAEEDEEGFRVEFIMAGGGEPLTFDVDPDTASIEDESAEGYEVQMQDLFFYAEMGTDAWLRFTDVDGEAACIRTDMVCMFSVPLVALNPDLLKASFEGEDEDDDGDEEHSETDGPPTLPSPNA